MKTYKLSFNSKSKSHKIPEAIQLSKVNFSKTFTETGNSISFLTFKCNRSFLNVVRLVKNLKGTTLEIDNEVIGEVDSFLRIIGCEYKSKCKGICTILYDYEFQLEMLGVTPKDPDALYNSGRWAFFHYDDAIEQSSSHYLVLKRDIYLKHYWEDTALSARVCSKYNSSKILEAFNALPNNIRIDFYDENFSIIDQLMKADDGNEGEMVVDISRKSIEKIVEEIMMRLTEFLKLKG